MEDEIEVFVLSLTLKLFGSIWGYVHTNPDKFKNGVFVSKTDKMFSVLIIVLELFRCPHWNATEKKLRQR